MAGILLGLQDEVTFTAERDLCLCLCMSVAPGCNNGSSSFSLPWSIRHPSPCSWVWSLSLSLSLSQDDLVSGLDFEELNITSQDDDILDEAAGGQRWQFLCLVVWIQYSVVMCSMVTIFSSIVQYAAVVFVMLTHATCMCTCRTHSGKPRG